MISVGELEVLNTKYSESFNDYGKSTYETLVERVLKLNRMDSMSIDSPIFYVEGYNTSTFDSTCENFSSKPNTIRCGDNTHPVNEFLTQKCGFSVAVFCTKDGNSSRFQVVTQYGNRAIWDSYFYGVLPVILDNIEFSPQEIALCKAIGKNDLDAIEAAYKEMNIDSKLSILSQAIQDKALEKVKDFGKDLRQNTIKAKKDDIEYFRNEYTDIMTRAQGYIQRIQELKDEIFALEYAPVDNMGECLYQYFKRSGLISNVEVQNQSITYEVLTTLDFYDEDFFLRLYSNTSSWLYRRGRQVADLLRHIFIDKVAKIHIASKFGLTTQSITPMTVESYTRIPHPHLHYFKCFGGNGAEIDNYIRNGEYELALEQSIAASKNINFGDITVCERFIDVLARSTISCIEDSNTGELLTVQQALGRYCGNGGNNE